MVKHTVVGVITAVVIIALGIGIWSIKDQKRTEEFSIRENIRIAVSVTPLSSPFIIADEKGYFLDQGLLDVTIKEYIGGHRCLQALLKGEVDIATASDIPIMFNSFKRDDYSVIFTFVHSYNDLKFITRNDTKIQSIKELKGKKIGAVFGGSSQFFLDTLLIHNGIKSSDIESVNIQPEDMPMALQNGKVDAVVPWEPAGYETVQLLKDEAVVIKHPKEIYKETFNALVLNNYAQQNKEILKRIVMAIDQAVTFINNNEKESQRIVMKSLNKEEDFISAIWGDFVFELNLDQSLILTLEDESSWAIRRNLTSRKTIPNYMNYIYLDAMEEVKPKAITIIR